MSSSSPLLLIIHSLPETLPLLGCFVHRSLSVYLAVLEDDKKSGRMFHPLTPPKLGAMSIGKDAGVYLLLSTHLK